MSNKLIDIIVTTENDTMNQTESQRNRIKAILEDGRSINPSVTRKKNKNNENKKFQTLDC